MGHIQPIQVFDRLMEHGKELAHIMVPLSFQPFFVASTGAAAALIGLLFVAVSVRPESVFGENAQAQHTLMASASFTALLNAFFISLGALIPGANLGIFAAVLGPIAILNSLTLGADIFRRRSDRRAKLEAVPLVAVALIIYGFELDSAFALLRTPGDVSAVTNMVALLLGVYVYGVARAWQLLGGGSRSVLTLIIPLLQHKQKQPEVEMRAASEAPPAAPAPATAPAVSERHG
jgi:hypothetical protein